MDKHKSFLYCHFGFLIKTPTKTCSQLPSSPKAKQTDLSKKVLSEKMTKSVVGNTQKRFGQQDNKVLRENFFCNRCNLVETLILPKKRFHSCSHCLKARKVSVCHCNLINCK